jgi:hypothetical protein
MKKITTTLLFFLAVFSSFGQKSLLNGMIVRHDTTTLKAEDCEWIIKSQTKTGETGESVTQIILRAIKDGKLKAFDPPTKLLIPANKIFTWQMAADTVATMDNAGNTQYKIVQAEHNPDHIPLIRIYQVWYFDGQSGKFRSEIKYIELVEEVKNASGYFIGYHAFCRINY